MSFPGKKHGRRRTELAVTAPSFLWLALFFAVPAAVVIAMSLKPAGPYGGFGNGWSLESWRDMAHPSYPAIVWRTLWLSSVATLVCVGLGLPVAFALARVRAPWRALLLLLVVVPFWTNLLIRVFAWKVLLHPLGYLRRALLALGVIDDATLLLYNEGAVLLVMVYAYLPFAILPLYAAAERFDPSLLDAARDLGASATRAFWSVFVPNVRRGILAAVAMVFIPCLGSYIIPDLVGGPAGELIGNKIAQRIFVDRNWPHAAALSTLLMALTLVPLLYIFIASRKARGAARRPIVALLEK